MNTKEDKTRDSIIALRQMAKLSGLCQQAKTYSKQGNHEMALTVLDRVLQTNANMVETHTNRGLVLTYLGRLDEARSSYRRAIELKPDHTEAYRWLTLIQKIKLDDGIVATMESLYKDAGTHSRINLGFALGKVYNDSGCYDKAACCYQEANRLNRKNIRYNAKEYRSC